MRTFRRNFILFAKKIADSTSPRILLERIPFHWDSSQVYSKYMNVNLSELSE